jgi:hypothetical protein
VPQQSTGSGRCEKGVDQDRGELLFLLAAQRDVKLVGIVYDLNTGCVRFVE